MTVEIRINGQPMSVDAATLTDLLRRFDIDPAAPGIAVARNGEVVVAAAWEDAVLAAGDDIEIIRATRGG